MGTAHRDQTEPGVRDAEPVEVHRLGVQYPEPAQLIGHEGLLIDGLLIPDFVVLVDDPADQLVAVLVVELEVQRDRGTEREQSDHDPWCQLEQQCARRSTGGRVLVLPQQVHHVEHPDAAEQRSEERLEPVRAGRVVLVEVEVRRSPRRRTATARSGSPWCRGSPAACTGGCSGSMPATKNARMSTSVMPVCTNDAMCGEPCVLVRRADGLLQPADRPSRPIA